MNAQPGEVAALGSAHGPGELALYRKGEQPDSLNGDGSVGVASQVLGGYGPDDLDVASFDPAPLAGFDGDARVSSDWLSLEDWVRKAVIHDWDSSDRLSQISKSIWEEGYEPGVAARADVGVQLSSVAPLPSGLWLIVIGLLLLAGFNSRKRRRTL